MTLAQHDEFSARLKRINSGQTTVWTVPGEGLATKKQEARVQHMKSVTDRGVQKAKRPGLMKLLLALVVGAVSVVAGRWATFAYLGADGPLPVDLAEVLGPMAATYGPPMLLAALLALILGFTRPVLALACAGGFAATWVYEHELVKLAPDLYAALYPPAWVQSMLAVPSALPI